MASINQIRNRLKTQFDFEYIFSNSHLKGERKATHFDLAYRFFFIRKVDLHLHREGASRESWKSRRWMQDWAALGQCYISKVDLQRHREESRRVGGECRTEPRFMAHCHHCLSGSNWKEQQKALLPKQHNAQISTTSTVLPVEGLERPQHIGSSQPTQHSGRQ